ncbi:MAG TPA: hypothetical protein VMS22_15775 [Candidatus Eisenbacteria bacterium]|nr:hypothetical protein [Candidatus Eisenbacteria bacterium]
MRTKALVIGAGTLMLACFGVSRAAAPSSPVVVQVPAAVAGKANNPTPPASATKKKAIGAGKLATNTANTPDDDDSFWAEQIDVDGDGTVDDTNLIWDDEDKVLYLYADGDFKCANGKMGSGGLLIALYGQGNTHGKPAGSGWYAVDLDEGECAAKAAGIYGCRFDAKQQATACGVATLDEKNDDLTIVTVSQ